MPSTLEAVTHGLTITNHADWLIFVERLDKAVRSGMVRKVPVLKKVWSAKEEWFLDTEAGEVYVYCAPDAPSLPIWEKLDVLKHLDSPDPAPLSVFRVGPISPIAAHVMKMKLDSLVERDLVEELIPRRTSGHGTEKWFKDKVSSVIYRLFEYYGLGEPDDIRWEVVPQEDLR